jgi:hypothetical protein
LEQEKRQHLSHTRCAAEFFILDNVLPAELFGHLDQYRQMARGRALLDPVGTHPLVAAAATFQATACAPTPGSSRRPAPYFRADFRKLFADDADTIADTLAEVMLPQRTPKARKFSPLNDAARAKTTEAIPALTRAEWPRSGANLPSVRRRNAFSAMSPRRRHTQSLSAAAGYQRSFRYPP